MVSAYQSARIGLERGRHDFELPAQPAPISKLGLSVAREPHPDNKNEATEPYSGLLPGWDGRQFVSRRWLRLKNDTTVLDSGHDLSIIDVIELAGTLWTIGAKSSVTPKARRWSGHPLPRTVASAFSPVVK